MNKLLFGICLASLPLCAEQTSTPCDSERFDRATVLASKMMVETFGRNDDMQTIAVAHCICLAYIAYTQTHSKEAFEEFLKNINHNIEEIYEQTK